jgi:hypothetical protein
VSHVVGNWEVSGIYQVQSGVPYTIGMNFDNANVGTTSYPNRVCSGTLSNPSLAEWFNTNCFVAPPSYVYGNEGRNVLMGPAMNNLDFALHRIFLIPKWEAGRVEFRAEGYNVFNHPQFDTPNRTLGTPGFGVISGTAVANRIVQVALRLTF